MTGAANRRRGADAERNVANYLRANGFPNARRTFAGDGKQLGDVEFHPGVCLEVKDVAQSAWPSWRLQAVTECQGRIPIVVRRTRGVPDVGLWVAQVRCGDDIAASFHRTSPDCSLCRRTGRYWTAVPFADVIAALRASDLPDLTLTERTT